METRNLIDAYACLTAKGFHTDELSITMHKNIPGMELHAAVAESGLYLYAHKDGKLLHRMFVKADNVGSGNCTDTLLAIFMRQVQEKEIDRAKRGPADGA